MTTNQQNTPTVQADATPACCSADEQKTCCAPSEKQGCCGGPLSGTRCGCK